MVNGVRGVHAVLPHGALKTPGPGQGSSRCRAGNAYSFKTSGTLRLRLRRLQSVLLHQTNLDRS